MRNRIKRLFGKAPGQAQEEYGSVLDIVNDLDDTYSAFSDQELLEQAATVSKDLKLSIKDGPVSDERLAHICALGREAGKRTLSERAFDVQLVGAVGLLQGKVIQMNTGEGKTLTGAIAAAGYALAGHQVHVVSVNDYLAKRDAEWMGPLLKMLGLRTSWIDSKMPGDKRREAYAADITYAPINELGFDVLRDRLVTDPSQRVTRDPDVVIVDEADSVLIDQARVPLVIAGSIGDADVDRRMVELVGELTKNSDYEVSSDGRSVSLTDKGIDHVEEALGGVDLFAEGADTSLLTKINLALHAEVLLSIDIDYIVRDGKVQLIDDSRGRVAILQRWPDGLQAAVEAKEGLNATANGQVLDQITVPALISRYRTVAGMTGTALGASEQLEEMYKAEVLVVPPNLPCVRHDYPTRLFRSAQTKRDAIVREVQQAHEEERPVLIGTLDIAESEQLAEALKDANIPCVVLNAKNDEEEAGIVAEAGALNAVTVSTQMAGRGTDIRLGGSTGKAEAVIDLGGLLVIGTSPHASSRLDDQLRGRSGRQGDPGSSVFFASLEDALIEQFAEFVAGREPKSDESGEITDSRSLWRVDHAQKVAEGINLQIHRNTWKYNLLATQQREIVLRERERILVEYYSGFERQVRLHTLDQAWADHLAVLNDLRESIHLRALAGGSPIDYFNSESIKAFDGLVESAAQEADDIIAEHPDGKSLEDAGLHRPSATWTYLVQDNPLGTGMDRIVRSLQRSLGTNLS